MPALLKSMPFWCAMGFLGVAGTTGVAAWRLSNPNSPHAMGMHMDPFAENEEVGDINMAQMMMDPEPEPMGCIDSFFPGIGETETFQAPSRVGRELKEQDLIKPKTRKSNHQLLGCTRMTWYYHSDIDPFMSDVLLTMKNDKVGWIIWAEVYGDPTVKDPAKYKQEAKYKVLFLENEEDEWVIKTGYSWHDKLMTREKDPSLVLWSPRTILLSINQMKEFTESVPGKRISYGVYGGFWEETEKPKTVSSSPIDSTPGNKVIKFGSNKYHDNYSELLGRTEEDFTKDLSNMGYASAKEIYMDGEWKSYDKGIDISKNLNAWFESFKGRKGEWFWFDDYCNPKKMNREIWWEGVQVCRNPKYKSHLVIKTF